MTESRPPIRVRISGNLVVSIEPAPEVPLGSVPDSRLAIGTRLAANYQRNGSLDGDYLFLESEQARSFAVIALDFTRRLAERDIERIEQWDFNRGEGWRIDSPTPPAGPSPLDA